MPPPLVCDCEWHWRSSTCVRRALHSNLHSVTNYWDNDSLDCASGKHRHRRNQQLLFFSIAMMKNELVRLTKVPIQFKARVLGGDLLGIWKFDLFPRRSRSNPQWVSNIVPLSFLIIRLAINTIPSNVKTKFQILDSAVFCHSTALF